MNRPLVLLLRSATSVDVLGEGSVPKEGGRIAFGALEGFAEGFYAGLL